jgi:alkylation response protein AidB-like acyl-CoA dehydrogenase
MTPEQRKAFNDEWTSKLFAGGWICASWPAEYGGKGLTLLQQVVLNEEFARVGAPIRGDFFGDTLVGPTILQWGTEEQKQQFIPGILRGEIAWCQGFSEPDAGSDLAGLKTRAELDGDEWVLNGQKVWTTLAHISKFGLLIARTNPDVPKHRGMTAFLVDMKAPGVEVRPLYQITGEAEFNEVFFTEARMPDALRIGPEGDGWRVAVTTLMNERVSIGGGVARRGGGPIAEAMKIWRERWKGDTSPHALVLRDRLVNCYIRSEAFSMTNQRASQVRRAGTPGPEGSVGKLAFAEENQRVFDLCVDMMGNDGMLFPAGYPMIRPELVGMSNPDPRKMFLRVRANSIEGGTSEVMRNILAERVLGLPGDVRTDKELPWKDVPRS